MNDFLEKWNTDPRFKTKIKLGLYTLFVVIVSIFAFSIRRNVYTEPDIYNDNNNNDIVSIKIPEKYEYTYNININEKVYKYKGSKDLNTETITKISDDVTSKYVYENDKYYKDSVWIENLVTEEEVYDIIDYNYLKLETINTYLSESIAEEDKYLVYLQDIVLGNNSEQYISITIDKNKTNIDYTSLMKLFDKSIESFLVEVIIEEIE